MFCHLLGRVPVRAVSPVSGAPGLDEAGERLLQGVGGHGGLLVDAVDVEPGEEGAVELLARVLGGAVIKVSGVGQQFEAAGQDGSPLVEIVGGVVELVSYALLAFPDGSQPFLDLVLRPFRVADEIEEPVLLGVDIGQLLPEVGAECGGRLMGVRAHLVGQSRELRPVAFGELDSDVVVDHLAFQLGHGEGRQVAATELDASADVVQVALPGLSGAPGVEQTAAAPRAPERALQVVVVQTLASACAVLAVKDFLNSFENFCRDQRFVAAGVFDTVVGDEAEVIAVAQHLADGVDGHRTRAVASGALRPQARVGERISEVGKAVGAGAVQLERHLHERGALRVDGDGPDLPPLVLDANVLVAQGGDAESAATLGFLAHLVLDVFTGDEHLVLVEDGDHAVHGLAGGGGVEVAFAGGDEGDAEFLEGHHHDRVVVPVPGEAGERVDDDVADVRVGLEVGDHLAEGLAVFDRLGGLAGVHELRDEGRTEFAGAQGDGFALGRQGNAFGVVVGLHLSEGGDAQVADGVGAGGAVGRLHGVGLLSGWHLLNMADLFKFYPPPRLA